MKKNCSGVLQSPGDPRLQTEIIPFVVETHGAAGPEACRLMVITKHQFGRLVLPCEDKSAEQTFYAAWAYRVSTAVQRGTALMIHNIVLGNSTKPRRTKDVGVEPDSSESQTQYPQIRQNNQKQVFDTMVMKRPTSEGAPTCSKNRGGNETVKVRSLPTAVRRRSPE